MFYFANEDSSKSFLYLRHFHHWWRHFKGKCQLYRCDFQRDFPKAWRHSQILGVFLVFISNNSQCLLWNQYSQSASFGFLTQVFSKSVSLWNIYFTLWKIPQMILPCIIASKSKYCHVGKNSLKCRVLSNSISNSSPKCKVENIILDQKKNYKIDWTVQDWLRN